MSDRQLLSEEQRRLMGISPRKFEHIPALFQPAEYIVEGKGTKKEGCSAKTSSKKGGKKGKRKLLGKKEAKRDGTGPEGKGPRTGRGKGPCEPKRESRRRLSLYQNRDQMMVACERAYRTMERVNATLQSDAARRAGGAMNEKARGDLYRADQEAATALESIAALRSAIKDIDEGAKAAAQAARSW